MHCSQIYKKWRKPLRYLDFQRRFVHRTSKMSFFFYQNRLYFLCKIISKILQKSKRLLLSGQKCETRCICTTKRPFCFCVDYIWAECRNIPKTNTASLPFGREAVLIFIFYSSNLTTVFNVSFMGGEPYAFLTVPSTFASLDICIMVSSSTTIVIA